MRAADEAMALSSGASVVLRPMLPQWLKCRIAHKLTSRNELFLGKEDRLRADSSMQCRSAMKKNATCHAASSGDWKAEHR